MYSHSCRTKAHRIWINFDRHALLNLFQKAKGTFVADVDEIRPQYYDTTNGSAVFASSLVRSLGPDISATIDQLDNTPQETVGQSKVLATPWYSDQILPFDITLAGANEYGAMCSAKIFGVEKPPRLGRNILFGYLPPSRSAPVIGHDSEVSLC